MVLFFAKFLTLLVTDSFCFTEHQMSVTQDGTPKGKKDGIQTFWTLSGGLGETLGTGENCSKRDSSFSPNSLERPSQAMECGEGL
jgi:hypothetical protein